MAHPSQEEAEALLEEARKRVEIGALYTHYKNPDRLYKVIHLGFIEATDEPCVIYEPQYGGKHIYVRTLENFLDTVDVHGVPVSRFTKVR